MSDTIASLWRSRLVHLAGFLVAAALGVLVDIKLPGTSHLAIFLPLAIGALTELGGLFGKFDAAVLNPRVRNLLMLAVGAVASYLTSTPSASGLRFAPTAIALLFSMQRLLAGAGARGAAKVGVLLVAFVLPWVSAGCAHVRPIVSEIETCAGPACADIATKILPAAELVLECELSTSGDPAALPVCAMNGLAALAAAAGPDGWRIVGCVVTAIEHDLSKPSAVRARARAARTVAARRAASR